MIFINNIFGCPLKIQVQMNENFMFVIGNQMSSITYYHGNPIGYHDN